MALVLDVSVSLIIEMEQGRIVTIDIAPSGAFVSAVVAYLMPACNENERIDLLVLLGVGIPIIVIFFVLALEFIGRNGVVESLLHGIGTVRNHHIVEVGVLVAAL